VPTAHLYIVGNVDGTYDEYVIQKLAQRNIHFVGRVPHEMFPVWIGLADVDTKNPGISKRILQRS